MPKWGKFGNVVICEHVVASSGNKHTLIGTYSGDILVAVIPARIPIAFYIEYTPTEGNLTKPIEIHVKLNGKKIAGLVAEYDPSSDSKEGLIILPNMAITLDKPSVFELTASVEGEKPTLLVKKRITEGDTRA